jgi:NADH dehydrogenase (ubiquinone) 1 alpha subcomplex subunit 8
MNTPQEGSQSQEYVNHTPMPSNIPHVDEVGATSAPLKSAAFFIGAYCKDFNGSFRSILREKGYESHSVLLTPPKN